VILADVDHRAGLEELDHPIDLAGMLARDQKRLEVLRIAGWLACPASHGIFVVVARSA
jgi:hypothetical protein